MAWTVQEVIDALSQIPIKERGREVAVRVDSQCYNGVEEVFSVDFNENGNPVPRVDFEGEYIVIGVEL